MSSILLTLALGGCGLPEEPRPSEAPATQAQGLALPPGLTPSLVKDLQVGPDSNQSSFDSGSWSGATQAAATSSAVYFARSNPDLGTRDNELWRTDGTPEGTWLVRDFTLGRSFSVISQIVTVNETVYLISTGEAGNNELWKSDGTPEGTVLVGDLNPGPQGSGLVGTSLVPVGPHGGFAFSATDGVSGMELWMSDGTTAGTRRLLDVAGGTKGSSPLDLTVSGSRLFFAADDGVHGRELWSVKHAAFK